MFAVPIHQIIGSRISQNFICPLFDQPRGGVGFLYDGNLPLGEFVQRAEVLAFTWTVMKHAIENENADMSYPSELGDDDLVAHAQIRALIECRM